MGWRRFGGDKRLDHKEPQTKAASVLVGYRDPAPGARGGALFWDLDEAFRPRTMVRSYPRGSRRDRVPPLGGKGCRDRGTKISPDPKGSVPAALQGSRHADSSALSQTSRIDLR